MSLKILGGTFRNRSLKTPKGPQTRPTLAILRKAVFDICQQEIEGAIVLDLFAGSGAMGLEALSRGAAHATFVDKDRYALSCIYENIKLFQLEPQAEVIGTDVLAALKKLSARKKQFDIVTIDPPYATATQTAILPTILTFLETHDMLKNGAIVFVEEGSPATLKPATLKLEKLSHLNSRTFSQSVLHQFRC
jgi:16S rRNA (guanine(966)-N(2))-methyltransferase RsmD